MEPTSVDGRHIPVSADSLHGAERERAWARIAALTPRRAEG